MRIKSIRVERIADTDEWAAVVYDNPGNRRNENETYYTNDKADAVATALAMVEEYDRQAAAADAAAAAADAAAAASDDPEAAYDATARAVPRAANDIAASLELELCYAYNIRFALCDLFANNPDAVKVLRHLVDLCRIGRKAELSRVIDRAPDAGPPPVTADADDDDADDDDAAAYACTCRHCGGRSDFSRDCGCRG